MFFFKNINIFRVDIQLYQNEWKLIKRKFVWQHNAHRAQCFHTISMSVDLTVYQHGKCFTLSILTRSIIFRERSDMSVLCVHLAASRCTTKVQSNQRRSEL